MKTSKVYLILLTMIVIAIVTLYFDRPMHDGDLKPNNRHYYHGS